jgi:hypothetical protein
MLPPSAGLRSKASKETSMKQAAIKHFLPKRLTFNGPHDTPEDRTLYMATRLLLISPYRLHNIHYKRFCCSKFIVITSSLSDQLASNNCSTKTSIFCDITPCSPLKVNLRFGGACRLHLQGRRISQARNQHKVGNKQSSVVRAIIRSCNNVTIIRLYNQTKCAASQNISGWVNAGEISPHPPVLPSIGLSKYSKTVRNWKEEIYFQNDVTKI